MGPEPPARTANGSSRLGGGLGLPLKDAVTALELTGWSAGRTQALLIESPEPLDFTEETVLTLIERRHVGPLGPRPPVGPVVSGPLALREALERVSLSDASPPPPHRDPDLPPVDNAILAAESLGDGVRLRLHPAFAGAGTLSVVVVEAAPPGRLYRGPVIPPLVEGKPVVMVAEPAGPLPHPPSGSDLPAALASADPGTVLLVTNDLMRLLGRARLQGADVDVEVPVQVLQNGDGRRALVIPLAAGAATALGPGGHRLSFRLTRRRWATTDPADDLNTYAREATIVLDL